MHKNHKLLVCIAFHYFEGGIRHLSHVMNEFLLRYTQDLDVKIIVDTNCEEGKEEVLKVFPGTDVRVHTMLTHPFHLTWVHRWHVKSHLNLYDMFMYVEYDMFLPYENYKNYVKNWCILRAYEAVPALMRAELNYITGALHSSDAETRDVYSFNDDHHVRKVDGKVFTHHHKHPLPYHAMWISTQAFLFKNMTESFTRLEWSREKAASYLIWEMLLDGHIEMGPDGYVSPLSLVYHLPANYANDSTSRLGQIPLHEALRLDMTVETTNN